MSRRTLVLLLATAALPWCAPAAPAAEPVALQPLEARVVFARDGERCRLRLDADLLSDANLQAFEPGVDPLRIEIGGAVAWEGTGAEDGARVRSRGRRGWQLRVRRAFDGQGRLVLRLDPATGLLRLVLRGCDAAPLRNAVDGVVAVRLVFGTGDAEASFAGELPFDATADRRWSWTHLAPPPPPPGGGGGGGGGGTPPPPPGPVNATTLASGVWSNITSFRVEVVRDASAWSALWATHGGTGPAPTVDFSRDMVIGVWLGGRPTLGYSVSIRGVHVSGGVPNGSGLVLDLLEVAPGAGCVVGQALTQPFHIVRTPRVVGTTTWELSTVTNCP